MKNSEVYMNNDFSLPSHDGGKFASVIENDSVDNYGLGALDPLRHQTQLTSGIETEHVAFKLSDLDVPLPPGERQAVDPLKHDPFFPKSLEDAAHDFVQTSIIRDRDRLGNVIGSPEEFLALTNALEFGVNHKSSVIPDGYRSFSHNKFSYAGGRPRVRRPKPLLFSRLANDTDFDGGTKFDRVTADASIEGAIFSQKGIKRLEISLNSRRKKDFVDVSDQLERGKGIFSFLSTFSLDRADLERVNQAPLNEGDNKIFVRAYDSQGRKSKLSKIEFELNRVLYTISSEDSRELALVNTDTDDLILKSLDDIQGWGDVENQLRSTEPRYFEASLTPDQVFVPEGEPSPIGNGASGQLSLVLDPTGALFGKEGPAVKYTLELSGVDLGGTLTPENGDDVTAIHLHSGNRGEQNIGVHTLNIFGLPGEDDADAVFDFETNTITGIWDNLDSTDDVNGGNTSNGIPDHHLSDALNGVNPISTKTVSAFVDELLADSFYIQVHTNDFDIPSGAIRGQVQEVESTGEYEASTEGYIESAFIEHTLITPDEQTIYVTVNGSLQMANAVVALDVNSVNWETGDVDLEVANVIVASEAGEPTVYPDGLFQIDDSQPIQSWTAQAWNQLHGPTIQPGSPIIQFSQWTNEGLLFIDDRTKELAENQPSLVIDGITNQSHGVIYNPSGSVALSPGYYWDLYDVDLYHIDQTTHEAQYQESIPLDSDSGFGGFTHFVSWVDDRYAYAASMQYGPTSLTPEGVEVATPGIWLIDAMEKTATRVVDTAVTADDPGVFRNPSDFIVVGDKLYVAEEDSLDDSFGEDGYIAVYDISDIEAPTFITRLKPGVELPDDFQIAHGLSPSADGKAVYVASYRSNYLLKIDTATDTVAKVYGAEDGLRSTHGGFAAGAYR